MSEVRQNTNDARFEMDTDGGPAFVEYILDGDQITFTHTEVPPEAEGKGIAGKIVSEAMSYARTNKLRVVPKCTYVESWVKRHPEYQDIVQSSS